MRFKGEFPVSGCHRADAQEDFLEEHCRACRKPVAERAGFLEAAASEFVDAAFGECDASLTDDISPVLPDAGKDLFAMASLYQGLEDET